MTTSFDNYVSLTFYPTDDADEKGNIIRYMPDLSCEYYNYMHNWFVDLIYLNPEHKEILITVLETFYYCFSPIEISEPCFPEDSIEDHLESILNNISQGVSRE